jgi:hypothetical protein
MTAGEEIKTQDKMRGGMRWAETGLRFRCYLVLKSSKYNVRSTFNLMFNFPIVLYYITQYVRKK